MPPELLQKQELFSFLYLIDIDLAQRCRNQKCPHCGGTLHQSNYARATWGAPKNVPEEQKLRQSFCCSREGCRKRTKPPSCIYMGRKVYWAGIVLVVTGLRQVRADKESTIRAMRMFGISYKTVLKWSEWFREIFPNSTEWKRIRGRVSALVRSDELPRSLLDDFIRIKDSVESGLIECLTFLATG